MHTICPIEKTVVDAEGWSAKLTFGALLAPIMLFRLCRSPRASVLSSGSSKQLNVKIKTS